jgi:cytochrome c oxidase cbb3-type subunit 3
MSGHQRARRFVAAALASCALVPAMTAAQQAQEKPVELPPELVARSQPAHSLGQRPGEIATINELTGTASALLEIPLVKLTPGGVPVEAGMANPMANDPGSAERGKQYFAAMNCSGCHAPDGGGGMGIALSNSFFKFGNDPANIYLVISHGAPLGMPSWGAFLPDNVIWDLVSYIQAMSHEPAGPWGVTASIPAGLPKVEQVPAEFKSEISPWEFVQPFSYGQKPTEATPTTGPRMPYIPEEPD